MTFNAPQRAALRLSPEEARLVERLRQYRTDLPLYARQCLQVVDKESRLRPLVLNTPQMIIHAKLEAQYAEHGMVRALILKGRKQGASTYIGARFYAKTRLWKHRRAKVMAHDQASTDVLFGMVRGFYANDPLRLQHEVGSAKQFVFSNGSSYTVSTAGGSGESGRGDTPTLAHMSEAAFYKNPEKNIAGFASSVPMAPGTEIIMESTANGIGNEFHSRWVRAEAGLGEGAERITYIPIFIPWFLSEEYRLPTPSGFALRADPEGDGLPSEVEIAEMYGLDAEQMSWRRFYVEEHLGGSVETFMQEFPCTPAEAFQKIGLEPFIKPMLVARARRRREIEAHGPRVLGIDPAGMGGDKFAMTLRQGHVVLWHKGRVGVEPGEEQVEWVADIMRTERVDRANVDYSGGWGTSLLAGLRERYPDLADKTYPVDFGGKSQHKQVKPHAPGPRNRRAEMYMRAKDWFELPEGVSIPDEDELQGDLSAVTARLSGQTTDTVIESKSEIKRLLRRSPDCADSFVLTFAFADRTIPSALTESRAGGSSDFARGATVDSGQPLPHVDSWSSGVRSGFDSGGDWML